MKSGIFSQNDVTLYFFILKIFLKFEGELKDLGSLEFDCFKFDELTKKNGLQTILIHLIVKSSISNNLNIDETKFALYAKNIQNGYHENSYHNRIHASDVCQVI